MKKPTFEKNMMLLALGALVVFSIGGIGSTLIPPLVDKSLYRSEQPVHPYTAQELRGMQIYKNQACVYCHTQQIRHLPSDQQRYGWRLVDAAVSESWEYTRDRWQFLGTKRTGPDLSRVGGKYANAWHRAHFQDPRNMGEKFASTRGPYESASVMPSFRHLSAQEVEDLTAYLQTLGRNKNWRVDPNGQPLNDYED